MCASDRSDDVNPLTQRPFDLYLPRVMVTGRADLAYDHREGVS